MHQQKKTVWKYYNGSRLRFHPARGTKMVAHLPHGKGHLEVLQLLRAQNPPPPARGIYLLVKILCRKMEGSAVAAIGGVVQRSRARPSPQRDLLLPAP
jgi:hypothetical protein